MPEREVKYVGYIRSSLYSKTIDMFKPENIVSLKAIRQTYKRLKKEEAANGVVRLEQNINERYIVDYDHAKKAAFPAVGMNRLLLERKLGDIILREVVVEMKSHDIISCLNDVLKFRYNQKGTPESKRVYLKSDTKIRALFRDNPTAEAQGLKYVDALNKESREQMNAAIGVLDLVSIKTERAYNYGEKENWPIDDVDLVRAVLTTLDFNGWPASERTIQDDGLRVTPKPAAIREYVKERAQTWSLQKEMEL